MRKIVYILFVMFLLQTFQECLAIEGGAPVVETPKCSLGGEWLPTQTEPIGSVCEFKWDKYTTSCPEGFKCPLAGYTETVTTGPCDTYGDPIIENSPIVVPLPGEPYEPGSSRWAVYRDAECLKLAQ